MRELEHIVQRAVLLCQQDTIRPTDLTELTPVPSTPAPESEPSPPDVISWLAQQKAHGEDLLDRSEEQLIRTALAQTDGNKSEAAKLLGTGRKRIERRAKKYGIQ